MTDRDLPPDDEDDALAAEYVLGLLPLDERAAAEGRAKADPVFAARVQAWEARMSTLNPGFAEVPAPDLLPAIERRLFPQPEKTGPRRGLSWGFLGGIVTAVVLALAVLVSQDQVAPGPVLTASLSAEAQPLAFEARFDAASGTLTLTRTAGDAPGAGQDLELWVIGSEGVPASLGLVRTAELTLQAPALGSGQVLAISLEPAGGSPTGAPTGPVLVTGILAEG